MSDAPPKGAIATASDFQIQRDDKGELLPVWEKIPGAVGECPVCSGEGMTVKESADEASFDTCENCDGRGEVPKMVKVIPMSQGTANAYLPNSGSMQDLSDRAICKLLNKFFVEPSFDLNVNEAEDELESFTAFGVMPLMMALYNASGFKLASGLVVENEELINSIEGNTKAGN